MAITVDKAGFPHSNATNAYDLLTDIAALAMAEPERMAMDTWVDFEGESSEKDRHPKCGTVGCIGGWTETLLMTKREAGKKAVTLPIMKRWRQRSGLAYQADKLLGLTETQVKELFYDPKLTGAKGQTCAHAQAVKAHIEAFQAANEAQLKAKAL